MFFLLIFKIEVRSFFENQFQEKGDDRPTLDGVSFKKIKEVDNTFGKEVWRGRSTTSFEGL